MNVTVVVDATRDHGFESPVLHEWLPPATPWTYMDSLAKWGGGLRFSIRTLLLVIAIAVFFFAIIASLTRDFRER